MSDTKAMMVGPSAEFVGIDREHEVLLASLAEGKSPKWVVGELGQRTKRRVDQEPIVRGKRARYIAETGGIEGEAHPHRARVGTAEPASHELRVDDLPAIVVAVLRGEAVDVFAAAHPHDDEEGSGPKR